MQNMAKMMMMVTCEDWHDEVENWAYIYEYTRE
jgi:hypothetical protein